ncbi:MAG: DUF1552 domain-containing protein, partial [Deltaproteobacteria bacterium]|nr:DUF1552 domain-containing protein [Deltaproteobacteria bacterium]
MISSRKFSQLKLSRRAVLRGAGGVAIALPWLEITSPHRSLRAAAAPARRFLAVYNPGGTVTDKWRPTGTETAFELSPILAPFLPVKKNILVLNGVDMPSARGEQNQCGMIAWLTGTGQAGFDLRGYAQGPSVDQVVANNVVAGPPMGSLSVAVRWGTGKTFGLTTPMGVVNFRETATFDPIKPLLDPVQIWKSLFGAVSADAHGNATWDRSILDAVGKRYAALARRLGAADRARMEQHLGKVREMEMQLAASQAARCSVPTLVDTSDYNPNTGLNSVSDGSV